MDHTVPEGVRLLVAVPTMGSVHPILVSRLLVWQKQFTNGTISFYFTFKVAPVERARNQVAEFFLTKKDAAGDPFTHLLFIDADTIPPVDAPLRMLKHQADIVTGLTPILSYKEHGYEVYDNAFLSRETDTEGKVVQTSIAARNSGVQEVFRCGASCLLIRREVFERIPQPYFAFDTNPEGTAHIRSEDIRFCDLAREAGFKILADTDVICQHYKDIMLD